MHHRSLSVGLAIGLSVLGVGCSIARPTPAPRNTSAAREAPLPTTVPLVEACDVVDQAEDLEPSITATRLALEQALSAPALPAMEDLLSGTIVITTYFTNETLDQGAAAEWLRQRAGPALHLKQLQRHHHVAVLAATTEGWAPPTLPGAGCLTFYFHRYAPAGEIDEDAGDWKIDVIAVE
jgi:hypothetical protein